MNEREKFEKWLQRYDPDQSLTLASEFPYYASYVTCMIVAAWQAALSTRKAYGYGIVDKDGGLLDMEPLDKTEATQLSTYWNENPHDCGNPHRVVELFYEDSES